MLVRVEVRFKLKTHTLASVWSKVPGGRKEDGLGDEPMCQGTAEGDTRVVKCKANFPNNSPQQHATPSPCRPRPT